MPEDFILPEQSIDAIPPDMAPTDTTPQDVVSAEEQIKEQKRIMENIARHKKECLEYVISFMSKAKIWRQQRYESAWNKYSRNYNSIYNPDKKKQKEPWQSTMFVPITVTNVEVISSALCKILMGRPKPIVVEKRELGDALQAELVSRLVDYEVDQSELRLAFYDAEKQACIYGSGFLKFYWKKIYSKRRVQVPIMENAYGAMLENRPPTPIGTEEQIQQVLVKDNAVVQFVDVFDIFKEPNSMELNKCIHRDYIPYGDIIEGLKAEYDPEAVEMLRGDGDVSRIPEDKSQKESDKGNVDIPPITTLYSKNVEIWEYWGEVPRKWIQYELDDNDPSAEELVYARCWVGNGKALLFCEENPFELMQTPIVQIDYIRTGDSYGMGICQLLENIQDEINEIRNQRIDNVNFILNKMLVVLEKAIAHPDDLVSKPMGIIRLRSTDDIRGAIMPLEVPDVTRSAYLETMELERSAQEVTAANRMTLGTAGMTKDSNQTLGGMQLLLNSAQERFTLYAYLIERQSIIKAGKWLYSLIYQNSSPERIKMILGETPVEIMPNVFVPRFMAFQRIPSHILEQNYDFKVTGTFTMGDKERMAVQMMQYAQTFAPLLMGFDVKPIAKRVGQLMGFDDEVQQMVESAISINPQIMNQSMKENGGQEKGALPTPNQASSNVGEEASRVIKRGNEQK